MNIPTPGSFARRSLFQILPAGVLGCLSCATAAACPQEDMPARQPASEKADMTWEEIFRFAFQKDLIPMLKELGATLGREKLAGMLQEATTQAIQKKTAGRPPVVHDVATYAAMLQRLPPLFQHALEAEVLNRTPQSFDYRVTKCLWAKAFRQEDAADLGDAMICHPDFAVARSLNPKLRLERTQTLMRGDDHCGFHYVMEA